MKHSPFRDLLAPVLTICVLLPGMAGMWCRYHFEFSAPERPALSGTLPTEHLEAVGRQGEHRAAGDPGGGHTISQPLVCQPRILGPTSAEVDEPGEVWLTTLPDSQH